MNSATRKERRPEATLERLNELLRYEPETGAHYWKTSRGNVLPWKPAGGLDSNGYLTISIDSRRHYAHRVAWRLHHQRDIPAGMDIDHANGMKADNRIENLRLATRSQNAANRHGASRGNKSGHRSISWHNRAGKWFMRVRFQGKVHHGGYFTDLSEAVAAAKALRQKLFGEFAGTDPEPPRWPSIQGDLFPHLNHSTTTEPRPLTRFTWQGLRQWRERFPVEGFSKRVEFLSDAYQQKIAG